VRSRGFTVLETVLAATLASVVVLGCMAAFLALERTDQTLSARFDEAGDLARIQRTMERAFATLLVAESSPEDEQAETEAEANAGGEQANGAAGEQPGEGEEVQEAAAESGDEPVEDAEAAEAEPPQMPRILLQADTDPMLTEMLSRSRSSGSGQGPVATPQRLELVLSSVPIRPPSVQSTAWADALVGVEDVEEEEEAEAAGVEEYAGVRGAFVLRPDEATGRRARAREARGDDRIGWTLWWQPLDDRSQPARIASGLAACGFQMFFDRQMQSELVAYDADQIPTYIQLEVETLTGLYANYLFEVVWTVDAIDEEAESGGESGENGQGAEGENGQAGNGQGGARAGRGGDGAVGENGARPKGLTPQGSRPGGAVTGRPSGTRGPGGGGERRGGGG